MLGLVNTLKLRNYRYLWIGQMVSQLGDRVGFIALLALIFQQTGSTLAAAGLALVQGIPSIVLGLPAGVVVDRLDKRKLMIAADLLRAVLICLVPLLWRTNQIFAMAAALAGLACFFNPAKSALIPDLVPKESLAGANGLSSLTEQSLGVVGPALGGVLVAVLGTTGVLWLDGLSFLISAVTLAFVSTPSKGGIPRERTDTGFWRDFSVGIGFVFGKNTLLRALTVLDFVALLAIGCINVLLLPLSDFLFHPGVQVYGFLVSSLSAGMIVGSLLAGMFGGRRWLPAVVFGGLGGIGACLLGLPYTNVLAALALCGVLGVLNSIYNVVTFTVFQIETPDLIRGRVFATVGSIMSVASLASFAGGGAVADLFGLPAIFTVAGVLMVVAGLVGYVWTRAQKEPKAQLPIRSDVRTELHR